MVGASVLGCVLPDDLQRSSAALSETLGRSGTQPPVEFRVRCADGAWRRVEVVRSNRPDDPTIAGVVIDLRDVTDLKQGGPAVEENESHIDTTLIPPGT